MPDPTWTEITQYFEPYKTDPPTISLLGDHWHLAFNWSEIEEVLKFVPTRMLIAEALDEPLNPLEKLALSLLLAHAEKRGWQKPAHPTPKR